MTETDPLKGLVVAAASQWLESHCKQLEPPFAYELVAAGGSNLTYIVTDGSGRRVILRRPPMRARVATAHDMHRECRVQRALASSEFGVPVPKILGECQDESVLGAEFYVMEYVEGVILRSLPHNAVLPAANCRRATESLVQVQVAMHTLDFKACGLDDLGRHHGYLPRQLKRWKKQVDAQKTRELPLLNDLHRRLRLSAPMVSRRPGLVHGDYRFDNTVLSTTGDVLAVLDWELCTIGDPVADFCWSLMYWAEPDDELSFLPNAPTLNPDFPRRADVARLYEQLSGNSLDNLDWYSAFSWWKMACIVEGVYARLLKGASGGMATAEPEVVGELVVRYLEQADSLLGA